MPRRLLLVHWNAAEARAMAAGLRRDGWTVAIEAEDGARAYRRVRESPPAAIVVSLERLPSHGIRTVEALASTKTTRSIPVVFVGGTPEAVRKARQRCPTAKFAMAESLVGAVHRAAQRG